jgi:hypothetical protein
MVMDIHVVKLPELHLIMQFRLVLVGHLMRHLPEVGFEGFIKRWPQLKVLCPRILDLVRATCKSASEEKIDNYFTELSEIMKSTIWKINPI